MKIYLSLYLLFLLSIYLIISSLSKDLIYLHIYLKLILLDQTINPTKIKLINFMYKNSNLDCNYIPYYITNILSDLR